MRGSRASQSETAILPSLPGSGGKRAMQNGIKPGRFQPLRHRFRREAEPAMRMLVAQEFEVMRREIHHQQAAAGTQHPRRLADGASAVVEEMQHLMHDHEIEGVLRQFEIVDVALAHGAMAQAGAVKPRARQRQHVEREIKSEPARDVGAEQFQHAAGAGAEIEQRFDRPVGDRGLDRFLHGGVGHMQLADAVPFRGMAAEIGLRRGRARGAHHRSAVRGRARPTGSSGASRASKARMTSAPAPCSAMRKKAQEPSRKRSTRPASLSSFRWREMRGCDWRKISVRSETVSSASAKKRENAQPGAFPGGLQGSRSKW